MLKVLALVAFGYLLGSVPSGWLVMKVYRNQDLRKLGSGNIGAANGLSAVAVGFFSLIVLHLIGWQAWRPVGWSVVVLGVALTGLVLYRHRSNIERLATGRELKITAH